MESASRWIRHLEATYAEQTAAWEAALARHQKFKPASTCLSTMLAEIPQQFIADSALTTISENDLRTLAKTKADEFWKETCEDRHIKNSLEALTATRQSGAAPLAATEEARQAAMIQLDDLPPELRKRACERWWRRHLRRRAADARQFWTAATKAAGGDEGAAYTDGYSLACWLARQERARAFGESHVISGSDGTTVSLAKVMKSARRSALARLYTMSLGQEDLAQRLDLVPIFLTLTLPPEWHPNPSIGECRWTPQHAPTLADAEIQARWSRVRALLWERNKIALFGLKVIEAHRDGCPHAHVLLYVHREDIDRVDEVIQFVFPEPTPGRRVASKLVVIDTRRARASTYVMKYLIKAMNIAPNEAKADGEFSAALTESQQITPPAGEEDNDQLEHFDAHRAWASERHVRRYSFLGLHGIQRIWQRLVTSNKLPTDAPPNIAAAWNAIQERRWAEAIVALGALKDSLLPEDEARIPRQPRARLVYDAVENEYGEITKRARAFTVAGTNWTMRLTKQDWQIMPADQADKNTFGGPITVAESCPRAGADAPAQAAQPSDQIAITVIENTEALIRERESQQVWQEWCENAKIKVHRLRTRPPPEDFVDEIHRQKAA